MMPSILMKCHKHQIDQAIAMIAQRVLDMDVVAVPLMRAQIGNDGLKGVEVGFAVAGQPE
ncbi:hypothetical protein OVY48_18715 [Sphingobium sp. SA2]|uniref:hypothetical protein n=1 Tax=Sphingobium sp. SA2 TaxID=1524832 RepID=UPI0028C20E4A|nr:hypothetical protein [Sphingobium sp. SA2]MDT7535440.1 hypothetical protein [Sphingobium sp. SA2]